VCNHDFFGAINPYKKYDETQQQFLEDLMMYICKRYKAFFHLSKYLIVEVGITVMSTCCLSFSLYFGGTNASYNGHKNHEIACVVEVMTMSINFDLWMFKGNMDTFALIINYLNDSCTPMHVTIGLFEVHETTKLSMALIEKYDLMHYVIAFVKDEGNNLMSMATSLHSIIDCHILKLQWVINVRVFITYVQNLLVCYK
jgi:hypothetical protein